jgi:hypothetical protein
MSQVPELDFTHINLAAALLNVAANAGVFKLAQYAQVWAAFSECHRLVKAAQGDEPVKMADVPASSLILVHNAIEFAANNNGFKLADYDTVATIVAIFAGHLKPHLEEAREGVEESKQ